MRFRKLSFVPALALLAGFLLVLNGCAQDGDSAYQEAEAMQEETPITLGPKDGLDLPAIDLERVAVGTMAPDFSLETLDGDTLTLSQFRGAKEVVLVFYRGHW